MPRSKPTVPPITGVRRPAPPVKAVARKTVAASAPAPEAVSAKVKSALPTLKLFKGEDWREEPHAVDPQVLAMATAILESSEPYALDVHGWTTEQVRTLNTELGFVKTHPGFEGARFYCKRGQLKNGRTALRISLSFPGRES